jgi:hypothetical protein
MDSRLRRQIIWITILYAVVVFGIHFAHTETQLKQVDFCPACSFIKASVSLFPIFVFIQIILFLFTVRKAAVPTVEPLHGPSLGIRISRAPPLS